MRWFTYYAFADFFFILLWYEKYISLLKNWCILKCLYKQIKFINLVFFNCITVFYVFSTMPEMHIDGLSSSHTASPEIDDFGTSYDSSTGVLVTVVESNNSTIAISSPKNTMDQDTTCCEIGLLIVYFCLIALVIMIATVFFLAKIRQRPKSQRKQGTKPSFEMELLSPPNAV